MLVHFTSTLAGDSQPDLNAAAYALLYVYGTKHVHCRCYDSLQLVLACHDCTISR
jgi:hypothetical protein